MDRSEAARVLDEAEARLAELGQIGALLHWDRSTEMPRAAMKHRAGVMSSVSTEAHALVTSAKLRSALAELTRAGLRGSAKRRIERYDREASRARKLPASFVRRLAEVSAEAEHEWESAKQRSDFARFRPYLEEIVTLKHEEARLIDARRDAYDVLLDEFEEGMTAARIEQVFAEVRDGLRELLARVRGSNRFREASQLPKRFSIPGQKAFSERVAREMLGDGEDWVLRESVHPFTTAIAPSDVRLTTAYREDNLSSIHATIHESGHALYELGLKRVFGTSILAEAPSLGIHESQSRFWENNVGRSYAFWQRRYAQLRKDLPELAGVRLERFYRDSNRVEPSLIRIYADEMTYPFHIIIRFEIERALIDGSLDVRDVPRVWNAKYREYLGIEPPNDAQGCLQDVHWSMGAIGYFPTYLIGTIYAAQIAAAMERDIGLREQLKTGEFDPIRDWLFEHIHKRGQTALADDIIKRATGSRLDPHVFLSYLAEKYSAIYR